MAELWSVIHELITMFCLYYCSDTPDNSWAMKCYSHNHVLYYCSDIADNSWVMKCYSHKPCFVCIIVQTLLTTCSWAMKCYSHNHVLFVLLFRHCWQWLSYEVLSRVYHLCNKNHTCQINVFSLLEKMRYPWFIYCNWQPGEQSRQYQMWNV